MFSIICSVSEEEVKNTEKGLKAHLFDMKSKINLLGLEAWYDYFIAKSRYAAPSFFKPSIAEVLECIPERLKDRSIAFEINPHGKSAWHCSQDGYHTFLVRVFEDQEKANKREYERLRSKYNDDK